MSNINHEPTISQAVAATLALLKAERDAAWYAFKPEMKSTASNDWPRFATANAIWREAYKAATGSYPPEDEIEVVSSAWYAARRYGIKAQQFATATAPAKTDAERDKGNRRKQQPSPQVAAMNATQQGKGTSVPA